MMPFPFRIDARALTRALTVAAAVALTACSQNAPNPLPGGPDGATEQPTPTAPASGVEGMRARVDSLEARARALATNTGCASLDQCAAAPMGAKACGGPRTYLAYCRATTDTTALFTVLQQLEQAEREYNAAAGIASDCAMVTPPTLTLDAGSCQAQRMTPVGIGG